jgi:hypothetical protein
VIQVICPPNLKQVLISRNEVSMVNKYSLREESVGGKEDYIYCLYLARKKRICVAMENFGNGAWMHGTGDSRQICIGNIKRNKCYLWKISFGGWRKYTIISEGVPTICQQHIS